MMFEPSPRAFMPQRHQNADGKHENGDKGAAHMQQKDNADQRDDDAFLGQRFASSLDRIVDQVGAVRRPE